MNTLGRIPQELRLLALFGFILLSTPLAATAQQFGDFTYSSDGSAITITGYYGPGGAVTIPDTIAGLPVTRIGDFAFLSISNLTSVTIPGSITSIGQDAFSSCASLTRVTIPSSVTSIAGDAFEYCTSLTSVTILNGVTNIGAGVFYNCTSLKGVFFKGNAPGLGGFVSVFDGTSTTVYYLPGTTGWGATFGGRPTSVWNPLIQTSGPTFGIGPAGFGFNITGTADIPIVVEAATSLAVKRVRRTLQSPPSWLEPCLSGCLPKEDRQNHRWQNH